MLFFKMYAGNSRVGALARGREVVCEADDGQDAAAVGDELSRVVEFCAGVVNEGVRHVFVGSGYRVALFEGFGIASGGHDYAERGADCAGPFDGGELAFGAAEGHFAEVSAEGGEYDLGFGVAEADVVFEHGERIMPA